LKATVELVAIGEILMKEIDYIETLKAKIRENYKRCRTCNFCYTTCPLYESSRGFLTRGPSGILSSIYYAVSWNMLGRETNKALRDILYACTTCGSCNAICKSSGPGTPAVEAIEAGRALLVELMLGPMPEQAKALESLQKRGNPYHKPPIKRLDWLKEMGKQSKLNYRLVPEERPIDVLLYLGCTLSYNADVQKIARSVIMILEKMNLKYGILKEEKCCGSPAKRMGEEGLFQELSEENLKAFQTTGAKSIITISPHCYNTFTNEYPEGIKQFDVKHYTEFLKESIEDGQIVPESYIEKIVTYHDPCYLGKKNSIYTAPRMILNAIPGLRLVEMKRNRENSLCCGGGGGRMWLDIVEEVTRLSEIRVKEALAVGAQILATACPWCYLEMEDAIKTTGNEGKIEVKDISEILLSSVS
jgi:Fe-S oxidoreductase